jgi:hypothetical protein
MKRLLAAIALSGTALVIGAAPAHAQCRGPDSTSARIVRRWKNAMANAQTYPALSRNMIPRVDSSVVVLVTDRQVCTKALRAYEGTLGAGSKPSSGAIYLIKVGTSYLATDPVQTDGEYDDTVVLDNMFRVKRKLLS